jgi:hypothetical protein
MRVENRLPGADANPYLAIAASLLCGYIGMVENRARRSWAVAYERRNLRLPITIEDALTHMEECEPSRNTWAAVRTGYVAVKRAEHENFKRVISSWEREFLLLSVLSLEKDRLLPDTVRERSLPTFLRDKKPTRRGVDMRHLQALILATFALRSSVPPPNPRSASTTGPTTSVRPPSRTSRPAAGSR